MNTQTNNKIYYLSSLRSKLIGWVFIAIGTTTFWIGFDAKAGAWHNFQNMVVDFRSVLGFFVSLLLLLYKVGFIGYGIVALRHSHKIVRAKLDGKGLYFKPIIRDAQQAPLVVGVNPLVFVPYQNITDIQLQAESGLWPKTHLQIETPAGKQTLNGLNVLSEQQKMEIFNTIQHQIGQQRH